MRPDTFSPFMISTRSIAITLSTLALAACAGSVTNTDTTGTGNLSATSSNSSSLAPDIDAGEGTRGVANALRAKDLQVRIASLTPEDQSPFPNATGYTLSVNGQTVQVYEYADEAAASADVGSVSRDGSTIGNQTVSWVGMPHFYHTGNVILLYLGNNRAIMNPLEEIAGPAFAGRISSAGASSEL